MEKMIAESEARLKAEDDSPLRRCDLEEDIDRDSSWVKRLGWLRHFGSRDLLDVFKTAEWVRAKAAMIYVYTKVRVSSSSIAERRYVPSRGQRAPIYIIYKYLLREELE